MASSQSTRISSLIKQLSAIEQQSDGSIYENENLRTDAVHLVRKLAVALERPQEVV
jgi:regulator of replication initiation timing